MIINADSDGVVYDFMDLARRRLERKLERPLDPPRSWNPEETWGISEADLVYHFQEEARNGVFQFGSPIPGAIDGLRSLVDSGHQVRIVTNKGSMGRGARAAIKDTVHWYALQGLLGDVDLVFTRGYGKQDYPADVVIDDQPNMAWTQEGAANILFNQPWNQSTGSAKGMWIRAGNWAEVLELVEIETEDRE